ncbi:hypothetical protein BD779DRAFT_1466775 [Infundibulicybe gibba]|nr:hypothetical protein BD779DRAFT_1466775 [Infundibulicybe gibba]
MCCLAVPPPEIGSSVEWIEHPNLFGDYICCDILKEHVYYYGENYTGGYSPALTLRGLLLQFLTFFSSTRMEQEGGYVVEIGDHILTTFLRESELAKVSDRWENCCTCADSDCKCPSPGNNQFWLERLWKTNSAVEDPVSREGDAVIYTAKEPLPGHERLHKLQRQNPRWASTLALISGWKCNKCPHGAGLPHHSNQADVEMIVAPPFPNTPPTCYLDELNDDNLSFLAAHLPSEPIISLAIVKAFHLLLQKELRCFYLHHRSAPSKRTILHASEKTVISFCHLFHLLICLCETTPAAHRDAVRRVRRFIDDPTSRTKQHLPDIGESMVLVILILALPDRAGPPITIARRGHYPQRPPGAQGCWRISLLHDNYGFAEESLPSRMVAEIKAIYMVNAWPAFFQRVQYLQGMSFGKERFSEMFRQAVRASAERSNNGFAQ